MNYHKHMNNIIPTVEQIRDEKVQLPAELIRELKDPNAKFNTEIIVYPNYSSGGINDKDPTFFQNRIGFDGSFEEDGEGWKALNVTGSMGTGMGIKKWSPSIETDTEIGFSFLKKVNEDSEVRFLSASAKGEIGSSSDGISANFSAGANLVHYENKTIEAKAGINVDTGFKIGPDGIKTKALGFGFSAGDDGVGISTPLFEVKAKECVIQ